nr:uncharacterized protein LOC113818956 [Penaeus vannamei]
MPPWYARIGMQLSISREFGTPSYSTMNCSPKESSIIILDIRNDSTTTRSHIPVQHGQVYQDADNQADDQFLQPLRVLQHVLLHEPQSPWHAGQRSYFPIPLLLPPRPAVGGGRLRTGGEILQMFKRLLGILTKLKTLELRDLLLEGADGLQLLVCVECCETLQTLILVNITKHSHCLLHREPSSTSRH